MGARDSWGTLVCNVNAIYQSMYDEILIVKISGS